MEVVANEAAPQQPAGTDLSTLVAPSVSRDLTEGLATLQRQKIADEDKVLGSVDQTLIADQARVRRAYDATGVGPDQLTPWNAEEQSKKFHTDPLDAFGSLGSVFAIVASAFTNAPMENALNGSAAAMNAIRIGDEQGYERAHKAWKENMELVVKRHAMQRDAYQDAVTLMNTNMAAGRAKLQTLATRFGDQKTLFLLENGMDKELIDLQEARNRQVLGASEAVNKITLDTLRRNMLETDPNWKGVDEQDPAKRAALKLEAFNRIYGAKQTPEQAILGKYLFENPQATAEETAEFAKNNGILYRSGGGVLTAGRQGAAEVARRQKEYVAQGMSETEAFDRATREVKDAQAPAITGNERVKQDKIIAQYGHSIETIDKVLDTLDKYVGAAGIAGKATRLGERVGNIVLGTDDTDRVQMMRNIELLQVEAPRLLLNASGRPLSAEAGHISSIIAGLGPGDTTANTMRAMREVKELYKKMQAETKSFIGGPSAREPAAEPAPVKPVDKPWLRDKRSD